MFPRGSAGDLKVLRNAVAHDEAGGREVKRSFARQAMARIVTVFFDNLVQRMRFDDELVNDVADDFSFLWELISWFGV